MLPKQKVIAGIAVLLAVAAGIGIYFATKSTTISALNFTSADGALSVRADRMTVSGGWGSLAELTNAYIDLNDLSGTGPASARELNIQKALSAEHFSGFPGGSPARIKASPVTIRIYRGKTIVTQFIAREGEIDLDKGLVVLTKEARSLSGDTLLVAEKIVFSPASASVAAERFVLQKPDRRLEGSSLTLDTQLLSQAGAGNVPR
jgi:hypothetical protein